MTLHQLPVPSRPMTWREIRDDALLNAGKVPACVPAADVPGRYYNLFADPATAATVGRTWGESVWTHNDHFRLTAGRAIHSPHLLPQ